MEPQFLCKKWFSSNNPYPVLDADYSDIVDMTEPDDCYSLQDIMALSISGQLSSIRIYDDYDDSEEGAEFEFGTDQFEYRQMLIDSKKKLPKSDPDPVPAGDPDPDPDPDPESAE